MPDPLPKGVRLLHIGPAKTGTTSLQSAFHTNRPAAREHGVHYAGHRNQAWYAAQAALALSPDVRKRPMKEWTSLVDEVQGSDADRVVISSEGFAHADGFAADQIVDAFGRDRTHVVITMRPLGDMLSSSWWQFVQVGTSTPYDEWLRRVLVDNIDDESKDKAFWRKSRIDTLAELWATRVGAENVTVISLAERPRDFVIRTFEELTGLPSGILVPDDSASNTTPPYATVELARQFNDFVRGEGNPDKRRVHLTRVNAYNLIKRNSDQLTDKAPIETPRWAVEQANQIAGQMNERLRALGVNVVGDLDALTRPSCAAAETTSSPPTTIPIDDAAAAAFYVMLAAERQTTRALTEEFAKREAGQAKRHERQAKRRARKAGPRPEDLGGRELVRLLARRAKRKLTRR